jgi:hypothetical protein
MTDKPEFETQCGWCRRTVISFVAPPAMVQVTHEPDGWRRRSVDRICLECYIELLKLITARAAEPEPA